jgi:branched-chain amino acid transport system substrate-binding protein
MKKYQPNASTGDLYNVQGYTAAQVMENVLKNCKDDLSRENILEPAASLNGLETAAEAARTQEILFINITPWE